jgi:hypothetical protein
MFNRTGLMFLAGAAIFALDASAASAQAKTKPPTSQKRIPITKEAPGEVVTPRVDTVSVTVYRTDTLRIRADTVRLTNTVVRTDTVIQSIPMVAHHIGGMYFGIGAGAGMPYGAIRTVNEPGPVGQAQLGWQGLNTVFGLRGDLGLTRYAHNADYAVLGDRPLMWNANADVRANLPIFTHTLGSSVIVTPYLIGGGSYVHFNNLRMKLNADQGVAGGFGPQHAVIAGDDNTGAVTTTDNAYHSDFGFNVGGGLGFHAGRKEIFVEMRGIRFNHGSQFESAWHVPLVFGVNVF